MLARRRCKYYMPPAIVFRRFMCEKTYAVVESRRRRRKNSRDLSLLAVFVFRRRDGNVLVDGEFGLRWNGEGQG